MANALAPAVQKGPAKVLGTLARHNDAAISGPVIALSPSLRDKDLADIAEKAEQRMLRAIAARPKLGEAVTDVLLRRGNQDIKLRVINNAKAKLSEAGFARLVIGPQRRQEARRRDLGDVPTCRRNCGLGWCRRWKARRAPTARHSSTSSWTILRRGASHRRKPKLSSPPSHC